MINNKLVLIEKYVDAINWIKDNSQELFLLYFEFYDEYENLQCISYSKMVNFLELLEQKASEEIIVLLNGKKIAFDVLPVVENGRTLVPLRAIFESLGADVTWGEDSGIIRAVKGETKVELRIGSNEMKVNNAIKYLDVSAKAINGRTMVPARAIAETFGCSVSWDATNNAVIIN